DVCSSDLSGTARVILYATQDNQFSTNSVMTFLNSGGFEGRFELLGTTQTLAGINDSTGGSFIQHREFAGPAQVDGLSTLILSGSGSYSLNGANITYTGSTTITNGTLVIAGIAAGGINANTANQLYTSGFSIANNGT